MGWVNRLWACTTKSEKRVDKGMWPLPTRGGIPPAEAHPVRRFWYSGEERACQSMLRVSESASATPWNTPSAIRTFRI
jgi:hypothetical protein